MKERLLDVIKWGLILIIAGAVFYVVYPKYYFNSDKGLWTRGNKMTGKVEYCIGVKSEWQELGKYKHIDVFDKTEKELKSKNRFVFEDEKTESKP